MRAGASRAAVLATVSVLAPLVFWSAVIAGAVLRGSDYDHLTRAISELSVGANAPVMNAGFIAYGVLTVWFALGLRDGAPGAARAGLLLLALAGAATAGLGIQWVAWSLKDGRAILPGVRTLTADPSYDAVHNLLAAAAYGLGALGSMSVGAGVRSRWPRYVPYFIASAILVITLALFIQLARPQVDGLLQRILVALLQLWPAVYAIRSFVVARVPALATART